MSAAAVVVSLIIAVLAVAANAGGLRLVAMGMAIVLVIASLAIASSRSGDLRARANVVQVGAAGSLLVLLLVGVVV